VGITPPFKNIELTADCEELIGCRSSFFAVERLFTAFLYVRSQVFSRIKCKIAEILNYVRTLK
jgi:hypothetical protein